MTTTELDLIESPQVRASYYQRTEALDKVKALSMLPDDLHVTTEMVANYYEVDVSSVRSVVARHRDELVANGYHVPAGREFSLISGRKLQGRPKAVFTRRAILNVGMLLRDGEVAKRVRAYLLNVEETADAPQREAAVDMAALSAAVAQGVALGIAPMIQTFAEQLARLGQASPLPDPWTGAPSEPALALRISSGGKIGHHKYGGERLEVGEVVMAFLPGEPPRRYRVLYEQAPRSEKQMREQDYWYNLEPVA